MALLITFTPVSGAYGQGQVSVTVTANSGLSTTKSLALKVLHVNHAPAVDKGIADQSVDDITAEILAASSFKPSCS